MHILLAVLAVSCLLYPGLALVDREHNTHQQGNDHRCGNYGRRSSSNRISAFTAATIATSTSLRRRCADINNNKYPKANCCYIPIALMSMYPDVSLGRAYLRRRPRTRRELMSPTCGPRRLARRDTESDDSFSELKRDKPLAARAFQRSHSSGNESNPNRRGDSGRSRAASRSGPLSSRGEGGRGAAGDDRHVGEGRASGGRVQGAERRSNISTAMSSSSLDGAVEQRSTERPLRTGIDQDDPLVKAWNSAKVLNPSRDEFPLGGRSRGYSGGRGTRNGQSEGERRGNRGEKSNDMVGERHRGKSKNFMKPDDERRRGRSSRPSRETDARRVGMYKSGDSVPWYIKEVQDKGLDTEGKFKAWWRKNVDPSATMSNISTMKVSQLRDLLKDMGLPTMGLKAELVERVQEGLHRFSLADDNFRSAEVVDTWPHDSDLPKCFPQVYEQLSEAELEELWRKLAREEQGQRAVQRNSDA